MEIVDTLKFIVGTLTTTMALGAGIGVVWAVFSGVPDGKVARRGYVGTAIGFAAGIFYVVTTVVGGLAG
jgi:hypothetical protein